MKTIQPDNLQTIKNFAKAMDITTAYVYKMINEDKIMPVIIDGVKFIDTTKTKFSLTRR
jgi:hypothetical protein